MLRNIRTYISNAGELVSRFRSSHHYAARSLVNFGIKGTLAIYDSSAVVGFEVPTRTRGYNDRNFKSTALADDEPARRQPRKRLAPPRGEPIVLSGDKRMAEPSRPARLWYQSF